MSRDIHRSTAPRPGSKARGRPRKSTAKQKPREVEETWHEIKDIIDERVKKGKVEYKVDWANNRITGQPYSPTWIGAQDANEDAVEDWNRKKRRRAQADQPTQTSSLDSRPVRSAKRRNPSDQNRRRRRFLDSESGQDRDRKRRRVEFEEGNVCTTGTSAFSRGGYPVSDELVQDAPPNSELGKTKVYVELPDLRPDFDPSEYAAIRSSQLSQYPTPESDYDPLVTAVAAAGASSQSAHAQPVSQRTIPDSQDFSTDYSQGLVNATNWIPSLKPTEDSQCAEASVPRDASPHQEPGELILNTNSLNETNNSTIPPRQPDGATGSSNGQKISTGLQSTIDSDHQIYSIPRYPEQSISQAPGSSERVQSRYDFTGFLTQPDFPSFELSAESPEQSQARQVSSSKEENGPSEKSKDRVIDDFEQSAQVVLPLFSQPAEFRTQSQDELGTTIDEHELIPETSRKESRRTHGHAASSIQPRSRQTSLRTVPSSLRSSISARYPGTQRAHLQDHVIESIGSDDDNDDDEHNSRRPSRSSSASSINPEYPTNFDRISRPSTPHARSSNMENSTSTRLSAFEELKQLQASAIKSSVESSSEDAAVGVVAGQSGYQMSPLPSAILCSVEQGSLQEPIQSKNGSATWVEEPALLGPTMRSNHEFAASSDTSSGPFMENVRATAVNSQVPDFQIDVAASGQDHDMPEGPEVNNIPGTIAPSALMTSAESEVVFTTSLPTASSLIPEFHLEPAMVEEPAAMLQGLISQEPSPQPEHANDPALPETVLTESFAENEYLITLPLPSNLRQHYLDILDRNSSTIEAYTQVFNTYEQVPNASLIVQVDEMLQSLSDLCNLPAYIGDFDQLSAQETMRYARDTNSKFSFIYELLEGLRDSPKKVLILIPSGRVAKVLQAVLAAQGLAHRYVSDSRWTQPSTDSPLRVILATIDRNTLPLPVDVDVVITFDQTVTPPELLSQYGACDSMDNMKPLLLSLVIAHSFDHIDRRFSRKMDPLERKNALLICMWKISDYMTNLSPGTLAPHEVAESFSHFINDPEASELDWEPQEIDDEVFRVYLSSQARATQNLTPQPDVNSTRSVSRKRQLEDDDNNLGVGTPKRTRVAKATDVATDREPQQISQSLRDLFNDQITSKGDVAEVSINQLESLAAKVANLESRLSQKATSEESLRDEVNSLGKQLRSSEKSIRKIEPKYMEALNDRADFEKERNAAVKQAEKLQSLLDASRETVASLEKDKELLGSKLAIAQEAMANSSNPDLARMARAEANLQEEQQKSQALEQRLVNRQTDLDFSQKAYQSASSSAASLGVENLELKDKIAELQKKVSGDQVTLRQQMVSSEAQETRRLYGEELAIRRERELELEKVREELRILKNGRHGTRQSSVPRSPRPSIMSPRARGAGSRGTSPAPMSSDFGRTSTGPIPMPSVTRSSHPHLSQFP